MEDLANNTNIQNIRSIANSAGIPLTGYQDLTFGAALLVPQGHALFNTRIGDELGAGGLSYALTLPLTTGGFQVILGMNWVGSRDDPLKAAVVLHELLHVATGGMKDSELADALGVPYDKVEGDTQKTSLNASIAITAYIQGGCQ